MVYYFSGTGNSEYTAEKISEITEEPLCSINDKIKSRKPAEAREQEKLIFVTPTYGWRIPRLVEEWIRKSDFGTHEAYFVMTCGSDNGNAAKYVRKLCKDKGFTYKGCVQIVMPENYIAMFCAPGEAEAWEIINRAEPVITKTARAIKNGEQLPEKKIRLADRITSSVVNTMFYTLFVHADKFYAKNTCTGCGKCVRNCPLNNVTLVDKKPVWGKNCTHCMACICKCPAHAIEYGKKSQGQPRYQCPAKYETD